MYMREQTIHRDKRLRGYYDESLETLPREEKKRLLEEQLQ